VLDHITLNVSDLDASRAFYNAALAPLGVRPLFEVTAEETGGPAYCGFGEGQKVYFWLGVGGRPATTSAHVAFAAGTRAVVDAFYAAALSAGGTDNGPPGLRPHYTPTYYGAFVLDPDGNNIEAVCHAPV
jgi:catechol 2,3-dioxygenase-like lactoylglutathione lyase family enzyme